ncbi:MAG: hypothetical protein B6D46_03235 [Polyangiaceae bacterium UTPRO1]|jgi:protein-S-isoprenylcysteine O-methyltransferase Ste14|nr:isoprenylcysteine carboxylmethyltransferase family protein [Myxococcales bacterium]OQY68421.1 MAG: hypothetical protein B6D46_03235 [Polyangiaceae bacterium UTPRO1]
MAPATSSPLGLAARATLGALLQPALLAVFLLYPPGTLAWRAAWVLVAVSFVAASASMLALARTQRALLIERLRPPLQRGQPGADKILVLSFAAAFFGAIRFVPYDVFMLHWLPPPGPVAAGLGLALVSAGWGLVAAAMHANAFAVPAVKAQRERGQRVVDRGPYAVVRHPMYAGAAALLVGTPLWLGSTAGVLVALVPIALLALRIALEERFLRRELPGYEAYAARVRARLVPGVW